MIAQHMTYDIKIATRLTKQYSKALRKGYIFQHDKLLAIDRLLDIFLSHKFQGTYFYSWQDTKIKNISSNITLLYIRDYITQKFWIINWLSSWVYGFAKFLIRQENKKSKNNGHSEHGTNG